MFRRFLLPPLLATVAVADLESVFFAEDLRDPMELAIAPDGDLYVAEREGRVLRVRPSTGGVFVIGELPVTALRASEPHSGWAREDGLLGLALDPEFSRNRRIYLYYSHPEKLQNRLSRFVLEDGRLDISSEKVLLEIPTDRRDRVCHQGGSLAFGPDGLLFLSTGDNTNPFESGGYAPIDDREGRDHVDAMRSAGNTNDLRGKILRIRPTEDGYEIPEGNLFPPGTPKTRPEIYVMGCRNPFRISIDSVTRTLYWGDVGPDGRQSTPRGPMGHDEVNQAKKAGNFGWPFVIANNQPYALFDFATGEAGPMTDPAAPKNPGRRNTGLVDLPPAQPAFIWYPYATSETFPELGSGGRNAMAGPVFRYDSRRKYNVLPESDSHTLLIYDWIRGRIWKAKLGEQEELKMIEPFIGDLKHPMDLEMESDGTLWLLEYGSEWYFNKDGRIRRLRPASGNRAPEITIRVENSTYTATATDPEGGEVTIEWWLTQGSDEMRVGEGSVVTLTQEGTELRAVAIDGAGARAVAKVALVHEARLPALQLGLPGSPDKIGFGEELAFQVKGAADPSALVVRARYIAPTGHDAGGVELPAAIGKLVTDRQCLACHQVDKASVGPSYLDVAMRYRDRSDAASYLTGKLKTGGGGVWGEVPMPPQAAVSDEEGQAIVRAILGLAEGVSEIRGSMEGKLRLAAAPERADPGGAWEISAEMPGYQADRLRIPAK